MSEQKKIELVLSRNSGGKIGAKRRHIGWNPGFMLDYAFYRNVCGALRRGYILVSFNQVLCISIHKKNLLFFLRFKI